MDLNITSIAKVPKQDDRRTILDFVRSQQSFVKAHAKEGKTYMASWKDESQTISATSVKEHPIASCGFATPVLKPRTQPRAGISSRNKRHAKRGKELDSKSESSTNARKDNQTKPRDKTRQREEQRENGPKRGPDRQTDEEQRLQERREKKKARRDVMRPESLKQKQADIDIQTKKKKQKLPSGLALMYGFTASNVGQKRLTVGPLTRPGVFGKGKASVQATVKRSKQKSSRYHAVFSESDFLKSAGKDHHKQGGSPCSSESNTTSSEGTDGREQLKPEVRPRRIARDKDKPEADAQFGPVTWQKAGAAATNTPKSVEKNPSANSSPVKPSSVVWDIEKANGVLPTESSSFVSLGLKPSTLLLDVAQKGWSFERSPTIGVQDTGPSIEQVNSAAKAPSVLSIRPSESPPQANYPAAGAGQNLPEGISRYFSLGAPPQVERHTEPPKDVDRAVQIPEETACAPAVSQEVEPSGSLGDGEQQPTISDPYKLDSDPELLFGDEIAHYPLRDLDDSDWLLGDPFLGRYPTSPPIGDEWAVLEDMLVTRLEDEYEDDPTAFEQMGYPYEESSRDSGQPLWLGEHSQPDHFSDEILGFNGCDDIPNLEQTGDEDIGLDQNDLTNLESDGSESDSDLWEHIKIPQEDIRDTESDHLICFNEGHNLLHGYRINEAVNNLELAEADVVQSLIGHWKPQRY